MYVYNFVYSLQNRAPVFFFIVLLKIKRTKKFPIRKVQLTECFSASLFAHKKYLCDKCINMKTIQFQCPEKRGFRVEVSLYIPYHHMLFCINFIFLSLIAVFMHTELVMCVITSPVPSTFILMLSFMPAASYVSMKLSWKNCNLVPS